MIDNLMANEAESNEVDTQQESIEVDSNVAENTSAENSEIKMPEGLPENFWDTEKNEILTDDLIKAYNQEAKKALDLRRKISEKGLNKAPKDINDYTVSEDIAELLGGNESESMALLRESAKEAGLSKNQFNFFANHLISKLEENGGFLNESQPVDLDAELKKLGDNGQQQLEHAKIFGDNLVNRGILAQEELPFYQNMITNGESLAIMNKIINMTGEKPIPTRTAINNVDSKDDILALMQSSEYRNNDPVTVAKVRKFYEQAYS